MKDMYFFMCLREDAPMSDLRFLGRIIHRFLECFQFNTHMVEAVLGNRLIAPDAETRIWKDADKFAHGEFVENVRLGSGIYPTLVRNFTCLIWCNGKNEYLLTCFHAFMN